MLLLLLLMEVTVAVAVVTLLLAVMTLSCHVVKKQHVSVEDKIWIKVLIFQFLIIGKATGSGIPVTRSNPTYSWLNSLLELNIEIVFR